MSDKFSKEVRSRIMASIKQKDTNPEKFVFRELRKNKIYFRKHCRNVPGTPDICLLRKKVAIFIDGDFWHGYRYNQWKRRLPNKFWREKIERNIKRDKLYRKKLRKEGWEVMRVWEHQIDKDFNETINKIVRFLKSK